MRQGVPSQIAVAPEYLPAGIAVVGFDVCVRQQVGLQIAALVECPTASRTFMRTVFHVEDSVNCKSTRLTEAFSAFSTFKWFFFGVNIPKNRKKRNYIVTYVFFVTSKREILFKILSQWVRPGEQWKQTAAHAARVGIPPSLRGRGLDLWGLNRFSRQCECGTGEGVILLLSFTMNRSNLVGCFPNSVWLPSI